MKKKASKSVRAPARTPRRASKTASTAKTKTARAAKKSPRRTSVTASKNSKAAPRKRATATRKAVVKKTVAKRKSPKLSPHAQKKRAMQHFQKLLEEKQQRDTQTPAWRELEHHDHSPPLFPPRKI